MKMKPGFKFVSFTSVVAFLCCSLVSYSECSAIGFYHTTGNFLGVIGIFSTIFAGNHHATALPPSLFRKRLGSPMPQIGSPISNDDEDSDEDEEDAMDDVDDNESRPRVEPHITPMNRDQCLAKLLCGMSVPVTGGSSKKNYYNEYADIVSKFFEAFPYDEEFQSKESIETYDDYSNEDDGKPTRMNSRRKPLNSTRMQATAPTLQLFDLALVDVGKPEDLAKNRTRKAAFEKVSTGNRIARARRIVDNLGQKLQTVRECQSIQGCPFTFKQLREKLRKKEAQKISSNVPLPPGPVWPVSSKRKNDPSSALSFQPKPYTRPQSRPRPLPPVRKPESTELFSHEEPTFPFKDTKTGDDEMEEIFGPAPVSKKPLGFHQGVDENFNYEYDKPWRPGQNEENNYNPNPWKNHGRPRPQPKPFGRPDNNEGPNRMPQRPRPGGNQPGNQKRYPPRNPNSQPPRRPPPPAVVQPRPKKPVARPTTAAPVRTTTTPKSIFPKKKISYLNSPYKTPNMNSGEDDEGSEDINKVAPVELIGNMDAGEQEPSTTTTAKPEVTETTTASSKKKKDDDDESDEYDDDDYYDDDYDEDDQNDDDDEYSDEEEDDKDADAKKKKEKAKEKKKNKQKKKKEKDEEEEEDEEEDEEDEKPTTTTTTTSTAPPLTKKKKKISTNQYFDDENEGLDEMWTKLNFATTGANHKAPEKYKKKEKTSEGESEGVQEIVATVSDEDAEADDAEEDEEDEEDAKKGSLMTLQKVRASSSSASDEDDDELDEENLSKPKRYKLKKSKGKKSKTKKDEDEEELAADLAEPEVELITREEISSVKPGKPKSKKKKTKQKGTKKGSSEEEDVSAATRRKQIMMEIGGRPLVPKPDHDQTNQKKTGSLIGNRFKFQFINPYGPAPPADSNLPGAYTPLKTSFGPNPVGSSAGSSMGGSNPSAMSSLPFKFKLNPGALGNLAGSGGGGHMVPISGFPGVGSSSSASGSLEMPDPHHPPSSSSVYSSPLHQPPQSHQQRHEHFSVPSSGLSGGSMGGSSLFKLNPLPALSNFFKRPSSSNFDPMTGPGPDGHGPPPATAFVHRPIGPESSHYNRERPSPASGSSNPIGKSSSSGGSSSRSGSTKKYKAKSKSRSNKGKSGKVNKDSISNTFIF